MAGFAGYVLPRIENRVYLDIKAGKHFGHSELAQDKDLSDMDKFKKTSNNHYLVRRFTV